MQVSGSDTEGSMEKEVEHEKARKIKIEMSKAEIKLKELH